MEPTEKPVLRPMEDTVAGEQRKNLENLESQAQVRRLQKLLAENLVEEIAELKDYPGCVSTKEARDLASGFITGYQRDSGDIVVFAERIRKVFKLDDRTYYQAIDAMVGNVFDQLDGITIHEPQRHEEDWRDAEYRVVDNYKMYEKIISSFANLPDEYKKSVDFKARAELFAAKLVASERYIKYDRSRYSYDYHNSDEGNQEPEGHEEKMVPDHSRRRS